MRILIVEDHPLIRMGLKFLITDSLPLANVTTSGSFRTALEILDQESMDLVILDIDIPEGENLKMMELIREKQPLVRILIYSGYDEQIYALPYLRAGADGFLSKHAPEEDFKVALDALLNKGKYVSNRVQQKLLKSVAGTSSAEDQNPMLTLSPREVKVMQLLTEGKWTKEIAAIMNVKVNTISTYKKRIFEKMDVADSIELTRKVAIFKNL